MYQCVDSEDRLEMAKQLLQAAHMAPLAPDLMWSYAFKDEDPFILSSRPHIFVIGNQPEFQTEAVEVQGECTRIILVPKFSQTSTIVLVNTQSLEVLPVSFAPLK